MRIRVKWTNLFLLTAVAAACVTYGNSWLAALVVGVIWFAFKQGLHNGQTLAASQFTEALVGSPPDQTMKMIQSLKAAARASGIDVAAMEKTSRLEVTEVSANSKE